MTVKCNDPIIISFFKYINYFIYYVSVLECKYYDYSMVLSEEPLGFN